MLGVILWRELLDHLQSLRFAVGFVLIVGCFVASAVSWNVRQPRDAVTQQKVVEEGGRVLVFVPRGDHRTYSLGSPDLRRPLSPLGFIAGGHDRGLPNHAEVHGGGIDLEQKGDRNPLLLRRDIDWAFVIGFLGTLLALLLTHDSIAGEKEGGTLRQTLANPVPRDLLLLAKYAAALISVSIPVLVGAVLGLLLMGVAGTIELAAGLWGAVLAGLAAGVLCLSAAVWLGLFISCRTGNAALALMAGLVVWSVLAVFIPGTGSLTARHLAPAPSHSDLKRGLQRIWREHRGEETAAMVARTRQDHWQRNLRQMDVAQAVTRISAVTAYRYFAEAISSTGIVHYRDYLAQAEAYRRHFLDYSAGLSLESPSSHDLSSPAGVSAYQASLAAARAAKEKAPRFQFLVPTLAERFAGAAASVVILLLYNLLFFLGAFYSFRRYDVR